MLVGYVVLTLAAKQKRVNSVQNVFIRFYGLGKRGASMGKAQLAPRIAANARSSLSETKLETKRPCSFEGSS